MIHPRSNAVLSGKDEWTQRDVHVHKIRCDGVYQWRRESEYYQQSRVENTFYRYKTNIGRKLRARTELNREVEAKIACNILNRFFELGRAELSGIGQFAAQQIFVQQRQERPQSNLFGSSN